MTRTMRIAMAVTLCVICTGAWGASETDVDALLSKLTLRQKVGQMMFIGFEGRRMSPEMAELVEERCLGGFFVQILSNYNFPDECARVVNGIQDCAIASDHGIPLFIAADQEGGIAAPIHYVMGATGTPGNMALGASGREEDAYAAYHAMGVDMRACGVTVNYAPAIDVLTSFKNPDYTVRSFGSDMARNGVLARGAVRGLQDAGVVACAKHFPGLAYFDGDTHRESPVLTLSEAELMEGDMAHFRGAIEGGTDMIMTVHAVFDAWDPGTPATLSHRIMTGLLRDELGFEGILLTDSMGMGGVTKDFGRAEATVLSVEAGCDMVLQVSRDVDELGERIDALVKAVEEGRLTEGQIDTCVRRVLEAKVKYGLFDNPKADVDKVYETMRRPDLVEGNRRAALNGCVLVRDDAGMLPLPTTGKRIAVVCAPSAITRAGKGEAMPVGPTMGSFVRGVAPDVVEIRVDTVPTEAESAYALEKAAEADIVIGYALLAHQSPEQVTFIKKLIALGKPTVIVGMGMPTNLALFPECTTFLAANSPAPVSTEAAVQVLFGFREAGGTLPMAIGDLYPIGYAMGR
ncbi:MAG: glycoside hydrolase family 3 protein [bacterium]|nr:glycoside hydrolase family 3 protein [bacterium]